MFDTSLPIFIAKHQEEKSVKHRLLKIEILHTLQLRPLTHYDITSLFDEETRNNLETLIIEGLVEIKRVGNIAFYQPSQSLKDKKNLN